MRKICLDNISVIAFMLFSMQLGLAQTGANNKYTKDKLVAERYWSIDLGAGTVMMPRRIHSPLLRTRPAIGFSQRYGVNYTFSKAWTAYAGLGYNFYRNRRPEILDPKRIGIHATDVVEALFGKFEQIKPRFDGGIRYRFQLAKWEILPGFGFSYTVNDWGRDRQLQLKENGVKMHYKMQAAVPGIQLGVQTHYWVTKKGYLHVGVQAEHPLKRPFGEVTYYRGSEQMTRTQVKSTTLGQNLYALVGYGFVFRKS